MSRKKKQKIFDHPEGSLDFTVIDVCRSEIDAAIDALVLGGNLIATHVLASAAADVMRGHAERRGLDLKADLLQILKRAAPGHEDTLVRTILQPYNSMKHSNSSDVAVTVHPSLIETNLFCATQEYGSLFGHLSARMVYYIAWYTTVQPSLLDGCGTRPELLLAAFPSAATSGPRAQQMTELKRALIDLIDDPGAHPDWQNGFATAGIRAD